MCVESRDTRFVERCIDRGIHYVDISATHELLSRIESLDGRAREGGSTVLLSVGLAPGLTTTPPGVFHIEQLFDRPREFIEGFARRVTDLEHRF